jgi:hypothetical protein
MLAHSALESLIEALEPGVPGELGRILTALVLLGRLSRIDDTANR